MTKNADIIPKEKNIFELTGDLDFSNVMSVYEKSLLCFAGDGPFTFDFANVQTNSAGIGLIIEWMKFAKQEKKKIQIKNLPKHLRTIIEAASMEELIA